MRTRGFWRLLSSCFPLVLAFLAAAVFAPPATVSSSPAFATARAVHIEAAQQWAPAARTEADQRTEAVRRAGAAQRTEAIRRAGAGQHLDADQPAALAAMTAKAPRRITAARAPQRLLENGLRAPAAPRGPPRLFA
jgi:hypothetical protein